MGTHQPVAVTSWHEEMSSAYLYEALAAKETGRRARLFRQLHEACRRQAAIWAERIEAHGGRVPEFRPGARVRLVAWLIGRVGPRRMLPVLAAMKVRGLSVYRSGTLADEALAARAGAGASAHGALAGAAGMTGTEGAEGAAGAAGAGGAVAAEESWHRGSQEGGALRAGVFGANDGLVSNASLIIGVAGADPDPKVILLAGVAGLLAGGFSMAAGEYISVRTQREMLERQIALEREELQVMPEEEEAELASIYEAKGLPPEDARALAHRIVSDPVHGLDTLAREELGLDPAGLASPAVAAVASFCSFAVGALVPLAPYLFMSGRPAFYTTLAVTEAALLLIGGAMSLFTGKNALWSALRMAFIGSLAALATHLIGRLMGVRAS